MRTRCWHSQPLRGHIVSVVNNYADTYKTTQTLSGDFEGFSQILKVLGCVYKPNSNNLKISKENFHVCIIVDYADTRFLNFAIEYLHENKKVDETVFACSYGAQVSILSQKNSRKSRDTVPLNS